jgi:hypothetical protein
MERYGITRKKQSPPMPFSRIFPVMVMGTISMVFLLFCFQIALFALHDLPEGLLVFVFLIPVLPGVLACWGLMRGRPWAARLTYCFGVILLLLSLSGIVSYRYNPFAFLWEFSPGTMIFANVLQILATVMVIKARAREKKKSAAKTASPAMGENESTAFSRQAGEVLRDHYEIVRGLGRGASGSVYLVNDTHYSSLEVQWVLKEVDLRGLSPEERREAEELFRRECALLQSLNHPSIPKIIEAFVDESTLYLIMEHAAGESLEGMMKKRGEPLEWERVLTIAEELAGILAYLHSSNPHPLIFRDLKPSNIIITEKGKLRLIDFGIARHYVPDRVRDTYVYGTPGFSPPEQYGIGQTDERSDIYALGATLYYLLTLEDPQQFYFTFPPVRTYNATVPVRFQKILARCLRRSSDERFKSAKDLGQELGRARKSLIMEGAAEGKDPWIGWYFILPFFIRFFSIAYGGLFLSADAFLVMMILALMAGIVTIACRLMRRKKETAVSPDRHSSVHHVGAGLSPVANRIDVFISGRRA